MLRYDQVKKLARGYTDRQITRDREIVLTPDWWSNRLVLFFEPGPEHLSSDEIVRADRAALGQVQSWVNSPYRSQVHPVELRPLGDMVLLRFVSPSGGDHWVDARYASAVYKRCTQATWWYTEDENRFVILDELTGDPVAILMEFTMEAPNWEADWSLRSESLDMGTLLWARALSAGLPRGRAGRRWCDVEGNHVRRVGVRKCESIEFGSRDGDPIYRISLYDGAVYPGEYVNIGGEQ